MFFSGPQGKPQIGQGWALAIWPPPALASWPIMSTTHKANPGFVTNPVNVNLKHLGTAVQSPGTHWALIGLSLGDDTLAVVHSNTELQLKFL